MPRVKSRLMRQRDFGRCINSSPARRRRFISCIKSYPLRRTSQVGGINLRPMRGEAYFPCIAPNLRQRRPRLPRIKSGRTPQPVRFPRSGSDLTQESLCLRRIKLMSTRRTAGFARIEPQMTQRRARARCCARHRTRPHSNSRRIRSDLTQGITAIRILLSMKRNLCSTFSTDRGEISDNCHCRRFQPAMVAGSKAAFLPHDVVANHAGGHSNQTDCRRGQKPRLYLFKES
jgi:hypothetical protein